MEKHTAEAREVEHERAREERPGLASWARRGEEQARESGAMVGLSALVPAGLKSWVEQEAARRTRALGVPVSLGAIVRAALEAYRQQPTP